MATGLQVSVGADTTEFRQEIRELPKEFQKAEQEIVQSVDHVNSALDGIASGLLQAGTVVALERIIDHFDKVADAASKYGESAEDIQRVGAAAELTGSNLDTIASAMERAGVAAAKAARGNEEFIEKFNRAGIDAAAFSTASLSERIDMVAKAQERAGSSGDSHASILEALGEATTNIDFQRIANEMDNVSVASNKTVEQLSRAKDTMDQARNSATAFAAEGLGAIVDEAERIGNVLGPDSGLFKFNALFGKLTGLGGVANIFGLGGKTNAELDAENNRLNAIALLRSRDGITNPSQSQINDEMAAASQRTNNSRATADTNDLIDSGNAKQEQAAKLKERLLEISLQLKEAEAANNEELASRLFHSEKLYRGLLKYQDAEDAYGMAVRDANAELQKRENKLEEAMRRQVLRSGGAAYRMADEASLTETQRKRAASRTLDSEKDASENYKPATESTLKKVASLMEQLNTKLPQPVLV